MGIAAIISLVLSVAGMALSAGMQERANRQNAALAMGTNLQSQEFARENAEIANEQTRQNYWELYSPQAKIQQYKEAGLNPALMYSMGGVSGTGQAAAQAAQPAMNVPYMNPLLFNMQELFKTSMESEKTKAEAKNINTDTKKKDKEIEKIESEIENTEVSTLNTELQNKLLENEVKIKDATLAEQIGIAKESYREIQNTADLAWEKVQNMRIDNSRKNELIEAEIKKLQAEEQKLVKDKLLTIAQTLTEEAKQYLVEHQDKELQQRLAAIERYGYMVVNGNGWQDRIVNALFEAVDWVATKLGVERPKQGGAGSKF